MSFKLCCLLLQLLLVSCLSAGGTSQRTPHKTLATEHDTDKTNYSAQDSSAHRDVKLDSPQYGATVTLPLRVIGTARGPWFFEGSFTVRLLGPDGEELVSAAAVAQSPWMTEEYVSFAATLPAGPLSGPVTLVLEKANPSSLPENEASVRIPLYVLSAEK